MLYLAIDGTIADRANVYSKKISALCCSQCHKPAGDELSVPINDDSLVVKESYHEELLISRSIQGEAIYDQFNFI